MRTTGAMVVEAHPTTSFHLPTRCGPHPEELLSADLSYMLPSETAVDDPASIIEIELDSILPAGITTRQRPIPPFAIRRAPHDRAHWPSWADNVVVLLVEYRRSPFRSKSRKLTVGRGRLVFTDGVVRAALGSGRQTADMWNLYTDETLSEPIGLSDGRRLNCRGMIPKMFAMCRSSENLPAGR